MINLTKPKSLMAFAMSALLLLGLNPQPSVVNAQEIAEFSKGLEKKSGLLDIYIDHDKGKIYLALDKANNDGVSGRYIYAGYLAAGLGSNPVGLDRSAPTDSLLIRFQKINGQMAIFAENTKFRATSDNIAEQKAVEQSFATSMLWTGKIIKTDSESGKILIDFTSFLTRDTVGVSSRLARRGQGNFRQDKKRSFAITKQAHAFPINLEFDAWVTFTSSKPGREVRTTTPVPNIVTLKAHTTLMKLPDDTYKIRYTDRRAPVISIDYTDMSAPLAGDTVKHMARRFRLEKDAHGKVIKPIVFYVDNGAPEPIRTSLLEGANWWAKSFDKAGYKGGFRAEILPEGVNPLDARYNVINWVHRATRGWSYGASVYDPRTGETLRGVVLLGSLRVRQDIKIFEALAGTQKTGTGDKDDPVQMALMRIRQLSAHEVGHPLGFHHNMGASSYDDRASVMDYPAPLVTRSNRVTLDFSKVYGVGTGSWDDWSVKFLYGDYPKGMSETDAQTALYKEADKAGLLYVSDWDSRSISSAHTKGAVWDNGTDLTEHLIEVLAVRKLALSRFGTDNLRDGESHVALQTKIVPLYLYHRYQLAAAVKTLGGMDFVYGAKGDGRKTPTDIPWKDQKRTLDTVLSALDPQALDLTDEVIKLLSPTGTSFGDPQFNREKFAGKTHAMFDHMEAASVASEMALSALLNPARLNRISQQSVRMKDHPSLDGVLEIITESLFKKIRQDQFSGNLARQKMIQRQTIDLYSRRLSALVHASSVHVSIRASARRALTNIKDKLMASNWQDKDHMIQQINDLLARAKTPAIKNVNPPKTPPGSPIGMNGGMDGVFDDLQQKDSWICEVSGLPFDG